MCLINLGREIKSQENKEDESISTLDLLLFLVSTSALMLGQNI